ncbi:gamma carbonic anhydrase family protein [Paenibacillus sp. FSL R7-0652]|uniref:gamma carbonic anhydrase family protein n=1 Tax=Paenibacillus sp. FSL R7-0652 TaxID=2921687 RepID=UPI00315A5BC6
MIIPYQGIQPQLPPSIYMAEGSKLIGDLHMGEESSVWFNAVLRADLAPIKIGKRCNIQDNAVGHVNTNQPLILGDDVSVGHAAIIHGCTIGTGTLIGMGAIVLNGADIGEYSLIGAGSVVTENSKIPPYTLALGTPARVIRELTEADLQRMSKTSLGYVIKGREYRSS